MGYLRSNYYYLYIETVGNLVLYVVVSVKNSFIPLTFYLPKSG